MGLLLFPSPGGLFRFPGHGAAIAGRTAGDAKLPSREAGAPPGCQVKGWDMMGSDRPDGDVRLRG